MSLSTAKMASTGVVLRSNGTGIQHLKELQSEREEEEDSEELEYKELVAAMKKARSECEFKGHQFNQAYILSMPHLSTHDVYTNIHIILTVSLKHTHRDQIRTIEGTEAENSGTKTATETHARDSSGQHIEHKHKQQQKHENWSKTQARTTRRQQ